MIELLKDTKVKKIDFAINVVLYLLCLIGGSLLAYVGYINPTFLSIVALGVVVAVVPTLYFTIIRINIVNKFWKFNLGEDYIIYFNGFPRVKEFTAKLCEIENVEKIKSLRIYGKGYYNLIIFIGGAKIQVKNLRKADADKIFIKLLSYCDKGAK